MIYYLHKSKELVISWNVFTRITRYTYSDADTYENKIINRPQISIAIKNRCVRYGRRKKTTQRPFTVSSRLWYIKICTQVSAVAGIECNKIRRITAMTRHSALPFWIRWVYMRGNHNADEQIFFRGRHISNPLPISILWDRTREKPSFHDNNNNTMLLQYYTLRRKLTTTTPVYYHASVNLARKRIILRKSDNGTRLKTRARDSKNGKILLLFSTIYYYTRLCRVVALRQSAAACHVITLLFLFYAQFSVFFIFFYSDLSAYTDHDRPVSYIM